MKIKIWDKWYRNEVENMVTSSSEIVPCANLKLGSNGSWSNSTPPISVKYSYSPISEEFSAHCPACQESIDFGTRTFWSTFGPNQNFRMCGNFNLLDIQTESDSMTGSWDRTDAFWKQVKLIKLSIHLNFGNISSSIDVSSSAVISQWWYFGTKSSSTQSRQNLRMIINV